jgi:hypothetical protein
MLNRVLTVLAVFALAFTMAAPAHANAGASGARAAKAGHQIRRCTRRRRAKRKRSSCASRPKSKRLLAYTATTKRRRRPTPRPTRKPAGSSSGPTTSSSATSPGSVPVSGARVADTPAAPLATGGPASPTGSSPGAGGSSSSGSSPGAGGSSSSGSSSGAGGSGSGASSSAGSWSAFGSHVQTWAYDDCGNGGSGASAGLVRAWVSFAEANCGRGGDAKALGDCHSGGVVFCDVIQYLDTNWIYQSGSPTWQPFSAAASESWYQHVPGSDSSRISTSAYGGGYLIDQSNPAVRSFFQSYVRSYDDADDGLMMDDQGSSLSQELYSSSCGCGSTDELSSSSALLAAHEQMSAALTHSSGQPFVQIDNALSDNPYLPTPFSMLDQATGVTGLVSEGVPESDGTLTPYYATMLDEIAYVADETSGFVVPLSYAQAGASYQSQSRRVQEATILLGYSPGHLVDWADLEQGSDDLAVWPEEGIYPTEPVQSMSAPGGNGCLAGTGEVCSTGGHNDLEVAPGVYRREFGACYDQGQAFGGCAAIVNTTGAAVTIQPSWLTGSYAHQITLPGGDVQSGGTVDLTGAPFTPGSTTIPAHDATLLAS